MRIGQRDLTAAARIRAAAITCFARDGFDAGLRAIAEEAGVSLGLIRHHYGSKEGLRAACDDEVLRIFTELQDQKVDLATRPQLLFEFFAQIEEHNDTGRYLVRALLAGGSFARELFGRMTENTLRISRIFEEKGMIRASEFPAERARLLTLFSLGGLLLETVLSDGDIAEVWRDYGAWAALPALELYSHGLLTDESMLDAYRAYLKDPPPAGSDRPASA